MGDDALLLRIVNSANIACGFHAGDPLVMRRTVRLALAAGVGLGAHPSFPDLQGFGRRAMQLAADELEALLIYQIAALAGIAQAEGGALTHVKPHGALNNMACTDAELAATVARAVKAFDPGLILLAPALSQLQKAGEAAGLPVGIEFFADRAYGEDGALLPRSQPGAVLHASAGCVAQVRRAIEAGGIVCTSGKVLKTPFHSICVHGDGPGALASAAAIRAALQEAGCSLVSLPAVVGV